VDKACSGINSLFSTLAVTLFYLLWTRAHWVRGVLLVLAAVFWVVVANIVRVSSIVLIDSKLGIDLSKDGWDPSKGMYYQHTILGFVLFGLILALVYSSNQFLRFLGTTVRWGTDESTAGADLPAEPVAGAAMPRVGWASLLPVVVGYGVLFLFQLGEFRLGAVITESSLVRSFNEWKAEDLPEQIGPWQRLPDSTYEARDGDNPFGAHSRTWQYQTKGGLAAVVSFDYPFPEWHDLTLCYKAIGWGLTDETTFDQPVKVVDRGAVKEGVLGCVQFELAKQFERRGYGWFTEFDQTGRPVPISKPDLSRSYVSIRWDNRFTAMRDRWLSLIGKAKAPQNYMDVLQVQVLVEHSGPLPAPEKDEAKKFFVQAADLIRAKVAAAAE
jgi:exosortase/archaeosortase family protein